MTVPRISFSIMLLLLLCCCGQTYASAAAEPKAASLSFGIKWLDNTNERNLQVEEAGPEGWSHVSASAVHANRPAGAAAFLIKFKLPELDNGSGLLIDRLTGLRFKLLQNNRVLYDYTAEGYYPYHRILVPLHASDSGKTLYLYGETAFGAIGIGKAPMVGSYDELSSRHSGIDLPSVVLGITLLFVAVVMKISAILLFRDQRNNWRSLSIMVMSFGILIILNCPFPYLFFENYAQWYGIVSDAALYICLPVAAYFFEQLLESGLRKGLRYWRNVLVIAGSGSFAVTWVNEWTDGGLVRLYAFVSNEVQHALIVASVAIITAHCILSAWERNREAIIICIGIAVAAIVVFFEIGWLMKAEPIGMVVWEWPMAGFAFHLIVLLSRRYVKEHAQAASYIRELELFQQQLHESEQREAASHLAASVAHEVRNPLSVTRGFLQLLAYKSAAEKEPLQVALQELDHAHDVITNYLKYAKPETDDVKVIDVHELLQEALTFLKPLLLAQGVSIDYQSKASLFIRGRASQIRQALITILMQRVHSLTGQARIGLQAYEEDGQAVIRITDDAKLFITTPLIMQDILPLANQITDAGLLFAMRSIEAMNGKIVMKKRKGGSDLIIRVPAERV